MKKNISVLLAVTVLLSSFLFAANAFAETAGMLGDVDADGEISASDARLILRHAVRIEDFSEAQKDLADVDHDGEITSSDARLVLRVAVGLEHFDLEEPTEPEQPTEPDEPTTENPLNYIGGHYSPERAGLLYDSFGYISTYEAIKEGDSYFCYDEYGYLFGEIKPYSPGNEPVHDLTKCSHCGKKTQPHDGEHFACYYEGYCTRWVNDKFCPECGVFVKGGTCHTCEH